jgi:hypothetical protein
LKHLRPLKQFYGNFPYLSMTQLPAIVILCKRRYLNHTRHRHIYWPLKATIILKDINMSIKFVPGVLVLAVALHDEVELETKKITVISHPEQWPAL